MNYLFVIAFAVSVGLTIAWWSDRSGKQGRKLRLHHGLSWCGLILVVYGLRTLEVAEGLSVIEAFYLRGVPSITLGVLLLIAGSILKRLPFL